jgi:TRAP transporter TAXI family solute receptor
MEDKQMKKNLFRTLALVFALVFVLGSFAGCSSSTTTETSDTTEAAAEDTAAVETETAEEPAAEAEETGLAPKDGGTSLTFTTGGDQGTYYGFGGVMAQKVGEVTSTSVTAITSGGSQANIENLDMGDADLGFVQSDVMAYAYNGERLFEETGAVENFSTVAALYMEQVQIVTLNPDIKTVADLAGKTVSIGAAGSGVYYNAIDVLGAYGLTEDDINPTYQSFGDSTEALQDGQIDAAFVVAGAPTTAVTSLAATQDVYLVSLDDEHIDQLIAESPYYTKYVIPADAYGTPEDVTTVAVGAVVIARDDVSDEDVYNFLYGVFENLDDLALSHDKANELSLEFATSVTSVPYHPGAVQYFADKGIDVPSK